MPEDDRAVAEVDDPTPNHDPFAMHLYWQPRMPPQHSEFDERCIMAGVLLRKIPTATLLTIYAEFTGYWESTGKEFTQAKWELKFLQHLINKKNRGELYAEPGQAGGGAATRSRSLVDDLTDRSWAQ